MHPSRGHAGSAVKVSSLSRIRGAIRDRVYFGKDTGTEQAQVVHDKMTVNIVRIADAMVYASTELIGVARHLGAGDIIVPGKAPYNPFLRAIGVWQRVEVE